MTQEEFGAALVATARKYQNVRESAGANTDGGGFIDQSLGELGLPPGNSWCAAAACKWIRETVKALDQTTVTVKFHRSARALGLWELNPDLRVKTGDLEPGDFVIWDHGHGLGHVALVTDTVRVNGVLSGLVAIAGNTSADGVSRNGDRVAEHPVTFPNPQIVGGIRVSLA